jgi:hypothetical protein
VAVMTVERQLTEAMRAGVRLEFAPDPERPVFRCPPGAKALLSPLLEANARPTTQALLRHAVEYRRVLLRYFRLTAQWNAWNATVASEAVMLLDRERRWVDDLGVRLADAVRAQVAEEWRTSTGLCPICGGAPHE